MSREAQTLHQETDRWSAEVLEVVDEYDREITGTTEDCDGADYWATLLSY